MRTALLISLVTLTACIAEPATGSDQQQADSNPIASCPIADVADIAGNEQRFYLCADNYADAGAGCGADGYLVGYGAKYASRFYNHARPWMTSTGKRWIDNVLVCLQDSLRASIDTTTSCQDIRTIAFDSHPACYVDHGFCTLPFWDILKVVWSIDLSDWASVDAARQLVQTAGDCGHQYAETIRDWFWYL